MKQVEAVLARLATKVKYNTDMIKQFGRMGMA